MMWPVNCSAQGSTVTDSGAGSQETVTEMMCIHSQEKLKARSNTAKRHLQCKHPSSLTFSTEKRERTVRQFEHLYLKQRSTMTAAMEPDKLVKLAPYKLAFVLGKHKLPYSCCESFIEFARAADPTSLVFKRMAGSGDTITSGVGRFPEVVRPTKAAHAQKSYTSRQKAWLHDIRKLDAL